MFQFVYIKSHSSFEEFQVLQSLYYLDQPGANKKLQQFVHYFYLLLLRQPKV